MFVAVANICNLIFRLPIDTYAMAGMALQCVNDYGSHVHNSAALRTTLAKIKQKLLASRRPDGHIGNEFSTGLAVQVTISVIYWSVLLTGVPRQRCAA